MGAEILHVIARQEDQDCAICALAMYLGISYPDVLRAVTTTAPKQGKDGLWTKTILRVAKRLGHPLTHRTAFDWETAYGILLLPIHAAVLRNGLVIDSGCLWDYEDFLADWSVEPHDCTLLTND